MRQIAGGRVVRYPTPGVLLGLLAIGCWAVATAAWADAEASSVAPDPAVRKSMQEQYEKGKSLYQAGDFDAAQRAFAEALRLGGASSGASEVSGPVAVVEAPLFLGSDGARLTDVREVSRYRDQLIDKVRDLDDRIGRLAKRELRYHRRWLESGRDAQEEQAVAQLQEERTGLERERQRLTQLADAVTQRLASLYYNQGVELAAREQPGEALPLFQTAADLYPGDPDIQYNLAAALAARKHYRQAAGAFAEAIRLRPDDAAAHYNLGVLYDRYLEQPQAAREHYAAYVRLAPDADDVEMVNGWLNLLGHKPPDD